MNVTIIGAGIVGCAVACELAARGAAVSVIDGRGVGMGATHASAGILAPRIEGHSAPLLQLTLASLEMFDAFVDGVRAGSGCEVEYERSGTLQVALNADEAAELAAAADRLGAEGVECVFTASPQRGCEPALSAAATATLLVPQHGYTSAGALTWALWKAAARRGATFVTARVESIRSAGEGPLITCGSREVRSDAVVVAAGSWTDDVSAGAIRPAAVRPIRGQLLRLRAPHRIASRVIWGSRCYIVPRRDGTVLVGATVEDVGFDERATVAGVHGLLDAAMELLPGLDGAEFDAVRVGLRPMTRDELPAIGRSSTAAGVFYATGHFRNGVLLAPLTASVVADLVLGGRERPELRLTTPARLGL